MLPTNHRRLAFPTSALEVGIAKGEVSCLKCRPLAALNPRLLQSRTGLAEGSFAAVPLGVAGCR
eukprot:306082-Amphidinium_carterae.1